MTDAYVRDVPEQSTRLERCLLACRKWGPPLLLILLGIALGIL